MAFFSFLLIEDSFTYLSKKIESNQKYYSKDNTLCKELNNKNKKKQFCILKHENRTKITHIGKKLLICLPPKFGLGDAIEYSVAINSLIKSNKFKKIGIAFCNDHFFIFKKFFLFLNIHSLFISEETIKKYDTIFHITLEIEALKFQKYQRSNIALEICKYFNVQIIEFSFKKNNLISDYKKTISIFPISTSVIRSLPFTVIKNIVLSFRDRFQIKIILDDSLFSKHLEKKIIKNNFLFVKPKNVESLILEVSKINFGIFVDSGPLHVAKIYGKHGVLIETSVPSETLLFNSTNITPVKNKYYSRYCHGPCGLVDIFDYNNNIGCYETNKISFENIKSLKSFKNLQRWDKKVNNSQFISNPVGCIKKIDINNIIELIKDRIKEC